MSMYFEDREPKISSEVSRLRRVVVNAPGNHQAMVTPNKASELLFEDIVFVPQMRREHKTFVDVISAVATPVEITELIKETVTDPIARSAIIAAVTKLEGLSANDAKLLEQLDSASLSKALVVGTHNGKRSGKPLLDPLPNLLFTRDVGAIINQTILMMYARKPARKREMLLARSVFKYHPDFRNLRHIDLSEFCDEEQCVEGGDLMVINDRLLLIGESERTNKNSIQKLAPALFETGIETILIVSIGEERSSMHLDTVFTMVSDTEAIVYPPLFIGEQAKERVKVWKVRKEAVLAGNHEWEPVDKTLICAMYDEGVNLEPIMCGGPDAINQQREQWTDGANVFSLAPGIVVSYERNEHTFGELAEHGYFIATPEEFIKNARYYLSQQQKVAITLPGAEMSRGRGGPRCMTMPLLRD